MPRKKEYQKDEVTEKAMQLFWKNGISNTSMRLLEKQMGINQFSIYACFGDKKGLALEAMRCYKDKITQSLLEPLRQSTDGKEAIKKYCVDFLGFSSSNGIHKGCFLTNTIDEYGAEVDELLKQEMLEYVDNLKEVLTEKIHQATSHTLDNTTVAHYVNYIFISLQGLSVSSQFMKKQELINFIDMMLQKI